MKPEDFKAALDAEQNSSWSEWVRDHHDKIVFALRLAEKVLSEPSVEMAFTGQRTMQGYGYDTYSTEPTDDAFKSMISQAVKEIEG